MDLYFSMFLSFMREHLYLLRTKGAIMIFETDKIISALFPFALALLMSIKNIMVSRGNIVFMLNILLWNTAMDLRLACNNSK